MVLVSPVAAFAAVEVVARAKVATVLVLEGAAVVNAVEVIVLVAVV